MKGDFTRQTFDPAKHYSRVLMQQGRVQLDADWNEQGAIEAYRDRTEAVDVIGHAGAPMGDAGGFALSVVGNGADLAISSGRMWVEGLLCENSPSQIDGAVANSTTLDIARLAPDGEPFTAGQWIEVTPAGTAVATTVRIASVDAAKRTLEVSPPVSGAGLAKGSPVRIRRRPTVKANADTPAGRYLAYLDVHERHITTIEDPAIREVALGGPDTTTRAKVVWRVGLDRLGDVGAGDCEAGAARLPKPRTTGALTARVDPDADTGNDCTLPPTGGYRGLEHQLYRVEVHQPGQPGAGATFKWQRDNGTVVSAMETIGQEAVVASVGLDDAHSFTTNDTVEASDDRTELAGLPGDLLTVTEVVRASRLVKLDHAPAGIDLANRPKLRRWDGVGDIVEPAGADDWIHLEHGLQIRFAPGDYATGDYWLIPARTATSNDPGDIEWPRDDLGQSLPSAPHGIEHVYAALAVVDWNGEVFVASSLSDCRDLFPPLTDLPSLGGPCTIVVEPGPAWAQPLLALPEGTDAEICFPVGLFPTDETVVLRGLGDIVVSGAGWGTELSAAKAEAVLAFEDCASVFVRDLRVHGGVGRSSGVNGALTFRRCAQVEVERVVARCSADQALQAACLVVGGGSQAVRVRDCRLEVGAFQYGLLVWDSARTWVEDNEVVVQAPAKGGLRIWQRAFVRDALNSALFRRVQFQPVAESEDKPAAGTTVGRGGDVVVKNESGHAMRFLTMPGMAKVMPAAMAWSGAEKATTAEAMKTAAASAAEQLSKGRFAEFGKEAIAWGRGLERATPAFALQGIVVGGSVAADVRIAGNTVDGALQGIHVGLSHADPGNDDPPDVAGRVVVARNRVRVVLPALPVRERRGIFVGNCDSLLIEDNRVSCSVTRGAQQSVEGIRVWGRLGPMAVVLANHLDGFDTGIVFHPVMDSPEKVRQWWIARNLAVGAGSSVDVDSAAASLVDLEHNKP